MPRRDPLTNEQRRLLRIAARMPLASVANLAPVLDLEEDKSKEDAGRPAAGRMGYVGGAWS